MRFRIGPLLPASNCDNAPNGWRALREPPLFAAIALSLPIGVALAYCIGAAWKLYTPFHPELTISFRSILSVIAPIVLLVLLVAIHELLHAVSAPGFGLSDRTTIGVWPTRGICYAHYDGEMTAMRFIVVLIMPLTVISVMPLLVAMAFGWGHRTIAFLGVLNALFSCVDVLGVLLLIPQVSMRSYVRNSGWRTWYRDPHIKEEKPSGTAR